MVPEPEFIPRMDDERALQQRSEALAGALCSAIEPWVVRTILEKAPPDSGPGRREAAVEAGSRASAEICPQIRALLRADIDQQWTSPLALARKAVPFITNTLATFDADRPNRDTEAERINPDDIFDVTPSSFAEIDPKLHVPGLEWGAAKSYVFLSRRAAQ